MRLIISIPELSAAQMESLRSALPDNEHRTRLSLEWHVPGDYYALPVEDVKLTRV